MRPLRVLACDVIRVSRRGAQSSDFQSALREAIQRCAISVAYQPQFDLQSGRGCGVEALARWVLANGETISPTTFIAAAEQHAMIRPLGAWVLESACRAGSAWCKTSSGPWSLSVNVSPLQIDEKFSELLQQTLERTGFPARRLELEITESALFATTNDALDCLRQWKKLGVRIALDDFGTGYSCLSHLDLLPLDRLKLDKSMIDRITEDQRSVEIVRAVVTLGNALGLEVLAEGVENEAQLKILMDVGCAQAQGYLFGRPMHEKPAQVVMRKAWGKRATPALIRNNRDTGEMYAS
jgi:EAL domain-containing protein (putative c-di-GMP-specific phosphodiesterase class I)